MPRQRLSEKVAELETRLWGVEQVQQEHMQQIPDLAPPWPKSALVSRNAKAPLPECSK